MSSLVLVLASIVLFLLAIIILWILSGYPPDDGSGPQQESSYNTTDLEDVCISEPQIEEDVCISEPQIEEDICISEPKPSYRSKGEAICCSTMEEIYGLPFKTQRPHWLINPESGRRMELDCYNEALRIAVEYNGIQHYVWPNHFIREKEDFLKQARRDLNKAKLCSAQGVHLIVVPYTVPHNKIKEYIQQRLKRPLN